MKTLIIIFALFAAVITLGLWTNHMLNTQTNNLIKEISIVEREIKNKQWDKAYTRTIDIEKVWDKKARWWTTLLDHCDLDEIKFSMARTKKYIAEKNSVLANGELAELRLMIENIPARETVSLRNIL